MTINLLSKENGVGQTGHSNGYPGKSITETIVTGFFTVDRRWIVLYWNKAAEKILGVLAKDIMGKNFWEKFAGIIPVNFYSVYQQAFLQDFPVHFREYWGEIGAWFDVVVYPCDPNLSVSFKSSSQSIEPEHPKRPDQQLQIVNELYRFVTEVTNDCLWEWDFQAKGIFWIDGGHKRVFGYPIENALLPQRFWESCLHPDDKERVLSRLYKMIKEKATCIWEDEYRFRRANGEWAYVHDRGHIIYSPGNKPIRMIGATQDITPRKLTEMQLVEQRLTRQKEITEAVLTAQEKERADIGKELHDNLNQILGATKLYIEMAKTDEENRELFLDKSSGFIVKVIEEIRKISKTLATPGSHIMGLLDSIRILMDDLVIVHSLKIKFYNKGIIEEDLDEKLQLDIFRIVQEQLTNILKHAKAKNATIRLTRKANDIVLLISDNGQGCDLLKGNKGVGIINIKSRVELHHGKVTLASKPGEGYALKVVFPVKGHMNKAVMCE